jgi:hypothetical protein
MARCAHCDEEFVQRRSDHRFCSPWCRHKGERRAYDPQPVDKAAVDRLFDPRRDPDEIVRADDWCPGNWTPEIIELYMCGPSPIWPDRHGDTVARRRGWFRNLELTNR